MKYGIITRNVTDLRAEPKFQSERKSQLLFDEPVTIEKAQDGYFLIHQSDGYTGWVDERAIQAVTHENFDIILKRMNYQVVSPICMISPLKKDTKIPPFIFYSARINLVEKKESRGIIMTGKNLLAKIAIRDIAPLPDAEKTQIRGEIILKEARKFLGTPYLWGGITPFGVDCSGLVQMVYRNLGVNLPRDSKDQRTCGVKIDIKDIKIGDLLFFKGHVAIAIDKHRLIHSSLGTGGVSFNSLNPRNPDYRKDLTEIFIEARRVI
jgi:beta-lactamase class A